MFFILIVNLIFEQDTSFFLLDSVYSKYQATLIDSTLYDSIFIPTRWDSQQVVPSGLRLSGAKDFSFDMNEGFDQGLTVEITGKIEGIRLEGSISDRATPSSTVELSDVERISLLASTKYFYGGIGNLSLDLPFSIEDEIQGGQIGFQTSDSSTVFGIAYAMNRGEFLHLRFQGEEGKQSPYVLSGAVVRGSEKVYLAQGIRSPEILKRDSDYLIDYEKGILSFTNNVIITNMTRIEVYYLQTTEVYPDIYSECHGTTSIKGVSVTGLYRKRAHDKHNPLSFTLTPSEIDSLRAAGDSARVNHTYADTSSQGSYILQNNYFVYVGHGNGDYHVTFFYVGENNGEYIYDPIIKGFLYQGPGLGNYSPTRLLPLPRSDEFGGFNISLLNTFSIDIFGSRFDRNTLSPFDDQDNIGYGYHFEVIKNTKFLTLESKYVHYDSSFLGPPRTQHLDYHYQYNTPDTLHEMASVMVGITPFRFLEVRGGYGILNRTYKRHFLTVRPLVFELGYEATDTLVKYFAGLDLPIKQITIKGRYEKAQDTHLLNYSIHYHFSKDKNAGISGSYDYTPNSRGITTIGSFVTLPLSLALGHRFYNDTTTLFGNAQLQLRYRQLSVLGTVEQSQRYAQKKDENYFKVDPGTGNYVYDPVTGIYLEKEGGDYIRKIFFLPEYERVIQRDYNLETRYSASLLNFIAKSYFAQEDDFLTHRNELFGSLGQDNYHCDAHLRQDFNEDQRFTLYALWQRTRSLLLAPTYYRMLGNFRISEEIEKQDTRILLQRRNYGGDIAYRIVTKPLLRPLIGYTYSTLESEFFENLPLVLHTPKSSILIGLPFIRKGRIEVLGELIYRAYNLESIPYYYAAGDPPGLTKILTLTGSIGISTATLFSLYYRIEFPPADRFRQTLRLQTRIRF